MRDLDQRYILFATATLEDGARTRGILCMRSIEELGRVVPLANELNLGLNMYCYCRLGKSDKPQHVTLIRGPII